MSERVMSYRLLGPTPGHAVGNVYKIKFRDSAQIVQVCNCSHIASRRVGFVLPFDLTKGRPSSDDSQLRLSLPDGATTEDVFRAYLEQLDRDTEKEELSW